MLNVTNIDLVVLITHFCSHVRLLALKIVNSGTDS